MVGKGLEKLGPVGAEISFQDARTIASLLAPFTRREGYHGWLNHPPPLVGSFDISLSPNLLRRHTGSNLASLSWLIAVEVHHHEKRPGG
jgi:hypothetical protein